MSELGIIMAILALVCLTDSPTPIDGDHLFAVTMCSVLALALGMAGALI